MDNPTAKPATDLRDRIAAVLRDRIAAVLGGHVEDQLTNYDAERNECGCGHQGSATYREHLADAVIRELELTEERATTDWPTPDGERAIATRVVSEWRHYHGCTCGWCVR